MKTIFQDTFYPVLNLKFSLLVSCIFVLLIFTLNAKSNEEIQHEDSEQIEGSSVSADAPGSEVRKRGEEKPPPYSDRHHQLLLDHLNGKYQREEHQAEPGNYYIFDSRCDKKEFFEKLRAQKIQCNCDTSKFFKVDFEGLTRFGTRKLECKIIDSANPSPNQESLADPLKKAASEIPDFQILVQSK